MGEIKETIFENNLAGKIRFKTERINSSSDKVTEYDYDHFNRLTLVRPPSLPETKYIYLKTGELHKVIDSEENEIVYTYDSVGQKIEKKDQNGKISKTFYDLSGNIKETIDSNGSSQKFEYDNLDRLVKKTLADNTYEFGYDINGNVKRAENKNSIIENLYDENDRLKRSSVSGKGELHDFQGYSLEYIYGNSNGQIVQIKDSFGENIFYEYDVENRISLIENHLGETFKLRYDASNRIRNLERPGGASTFEYNDSSLVSKILHKKGGVDKYKIEYKRNDLGFPNEINTNFGVHKFEYDSNSQIKSANHPPSTYTGSASETFSYDSIGNRIGDESGAYTYGMKRQLLKEDSKYFYMYDENGNQIQRHNKLNGHVIKFEYNSENQLTKYEKLESFSGPTLIEVAYHYDAIGRRMQKTTIDSLFPADSKKTFTRKYLYDGNEIFAELNEQNETLARYTHSKIRTDDVLAVDITDIGVDAGLAKRSGSFFYLKDSLGSIIGVTDNESNIVQTYNYLSYGKILNIKDSSGNNILGNPILNTSFSFTGREYDKETGLFFYRARYYDSEIGRFLQKDPVAGVLNLPISVTNSYAYGRNNPQYFVDPLGRFSFGNLLLTVAIVTAAVYTGGAVGAIAGKFVGGGFLGGAAGLAAGALAGGITGGFIGGISYELFNMGSFVDGFNTGFVQGAISGGLAGLISGIGSQPSSTFDLANNTEAPFRMRDLSLCGGILGGLLFSTKVFQIDVPIDNFQDVQDVEDLDPLDDFETGELVCKDWGVG